MKTFIATVVIILTASTFAHAQNLSKRNTISLNGNWQIAEGTKDVIPKSFDHTVQVPGLVFCTRWSSTSKKNVYYI